MNLNQAREEVLHGVLYEKVENSSFGSRRIDSAIQFIGEEFCDVTRCVRVASDVVIPLGQHIIDIPAMPGFERFLENHFINADIAAYPVQKNPNVDSIKRRWQGASPSGRPTQIAFEGPTRAWLDKAPTSATTMSVFRCMPFTSFELGINDAAATLVELNIPDQYLHGLLRFGACTAMIYNDRNCTYAQTGFQISQATRDRIARDYRPELDSPRRIDSPTYKIPEAAKAA